MKEFSDELLISIDLYKLEYGNVVLTLLYLIAYKIF